MQRDLLGTAPQKAWFIIKDYQDTVAHEQLSRIALAKRALSDWEPIEVEE